jgi:hypothetical protein
MKLRCFLFLAVCTLAPEARGQGCSQCREAVGQPPARTQQAYRRGIEVIVLAAGGVCAATVLVARRFR